MDINKNDVEFWNKKGLDLYAQKKHIEALACYETAIDIDSNHLDVRMNKINALNRLRRFDETIVFCDETLKINSKFSRAWGGKGNALSGLGKHQSALACYDKAISLEPKQILTFWFSKGVVLIRLERYQEALSCFNEVLKIDPNHINSLYKKGCILIRLERYQEALSCFNEVLKIDPNHINSLYVKGTGLMRLKKNQEALICYDEITKLNPDYAEAWYRKGINLYALGRYRKALPCLDTAINLNSMFSKKARHFKVQALSKIGKAEYLGKHFEELERSDFVNCGFESRPVVGEEVRFVCKSCGRIVEGKESIDEWIDFKQTKFRCPFCGGISELPRYLCD